jgi:hypothetical protein
MSQIEHGVFMEYPEVKSTLQRDIIAIFHEWHKEDSLTFQKIQEVLIERGQLKTGEGQERWLREKIKRLRDSNILIDIKLPHKKKAGRPPIAYKLNENALYELFKLTEDLVDAMNFGQLESSPGKTVVTKFAIKYGNKFKSLRDPEKMNGELVVVGKQAKKEDLEKTWRLDHHIEELQNYCNRDNPAYKEYTLLKSIEMMKKVGEGGPPEGTI